MIYSCDKQPWFRIARTIMHIVFIAALYAYGAKSADQLKNDFAGLLGDGTYARIAWSKGGSNATSAEIYTYGDAATKIMVLDTKDGKVRELSADQPSGHMINASFTWDGQRIVFYNNSARQVLISNWDGSECSVLLNNYFSSRCWKSSDNKHWVLAHSFANSRLYRINIDDATEKTEIYNGTTQWADLSPDGLYLAATFPDYPNAGVLNLSGQANPLIFGQANSDYGGCWPSIARDNSHRVLYTIEPHTNYRIVDSEGNELMNQHVGQELLPSSLQYREYNALRWTNDPDIITFWIDGGSDVNPVVQRISTREWVCINDDCGSINEGNTDAYIYTIDPGTTISRKSPASRSMRQARPSISTYAFDCRGRLVSKASARDAGKHGIRIIQPAGRSSQPALIF